MKKCLQAFLLCFFAVLFADADNCSELVGTCEYYQCVEKKERCGSDGYYLEFGDHYCRKYQAKQHKYTERGQHFLVGIRTCLQQELERERLRTGDYLKCSQVKDFAIETHKYCYEQYDFCGLPKTDQFKVKLTAKTELLDYKMLKFAFWLEKSCL